VLAPTPEQKEVAKDVPPEILEKYVGVYKGDKDSYKPVELKNGKLILADYGVELIPQSPTVFRMKFNEGTISFSQGQMVYEAEGKSEKFTLIQTSAPKDLATFAGDYYSPELDTIWELRIRGGELTAQPRHSDNQPMMLRAITEHTFALEGGVLRFETEADIPERAFLTVDRIRGIEFMRNQH
jgi:hypothetical protein